MKAVTQGMGWLAVLGAALVPVSTAQATSPQITASAFCEAGGAWAGWQVSVPSSWGEHPNVVVEISVDYGPWTQVDSGALAAPDYMFSGQTELPPGSLSFRARASALGPWSSGVINEAPNYANSSRWEEWAANDIEVPTDCAPPNPGTGTPGYWKNHPEAWPADSLTIGTVAYSREEAIDVLKTPTRGDATYILARALIAAELNAMIGNDISCIVEALDDAQAWLTDHPVGSRLKARDAAWTVGGGLASVLDAYNNGDLCAPHRD